MVKWLLSFFLVIYLASNADIFAVDTVDGVNLPIAYAKSAKKVKKTVFKQMIVTNSDKVQAKQQNGSIKW